MSGGASEPVTSVVTTGWRARTDPRAAVWRVRESTIPIVQIVVAATAAYAFAHFVLQHGAPLLAATVTISSLGLVRDARPERILRSVLGMLLGIAVAEVLLIGLGQGWWQLALALAATLLLARFLSAEPSFAIAAAIQAAIVMVLPTGAPFLKLVDGVVGGVAALLVTALIPRNPLRAAQADGHRLVAGMQGAAATIVQALRRGDRLRAERGLEKARALQPLIDDWHTSLESGLAIARISPFLRRQRFELARQERMRHALDLAIRNLRVTARRAVYLCDDGAARPVAADILADLMRCTVTLSDALDDIALEPAARDALLAVASRLDPAQLLPDASLGDQNLITAMRPLAVDLLTATGMPSADARAAAPRI